jgi:stage V sporulation protein B
MFLSIKGKIASFYRNRLVRDTATLEVGTISASFIQAFVGIFLARFLQPELFGVYTLAFSLAVLIIVFVSIGSQEAIAALIGEAYAKNDKAEVKETSAFLIKIFIITGLLALIGIFFAPFLADVFYGNQDIGIFAGYFIAAIFLSNSIFTLSKNGLQVLGEMKKMTAMILADQAVRSGLSLLFVFLGLGVFGAVSGHLAGALIILAVSILTWNWIRKRNDIFPSLSSLISSFRRTKIKKYLGFSIWVAIDKNISMLYMVLPIILTGIYVAASEVAFFKLAFAYINLATALLAPISILLNVEFPKMKIQNIGNLSSNFVKISLYSTALSAVLTLGAVLVAPWAFQLFYGESFAPSVKYIYGLFVYGALMGIGVGLGSMWRAINQVKTSIIINIVTLTVGIPTGLWLIKNYSIWGAVIMVTLWFTVSHTISFIYLVNKLKKNDT